MKARISVTKKNIEEGKAGLSGSCPVALALHRRGLEDALVDPRIWRVLSTWWYDLANDFPASADGNDYFEFDLSKRTQEFIRDFDDGMEVKPFSFTINDPWLRKDSNGKLYFA